MKRVLTAIILTVAVITSVAAQKRTTTFTYKDGMSRESVITVTYDTEMKGKIITTLPYIQCTDNTSIQMNILAPLFNEWKEYAELTIEYQGIPGETFCGTQHLYNLGNNEWLNISISK